VPAASAPLAPQPWDRKRVSVFLDANARFDGAVSALTRNGSRLHAAFSNSRDAVDRVRFFPADAAGMRDQVRSTSTPARDRNLHRDRPNRPGLSADHSHDERHCELGIDPGFRIRDTDRAVAPRSAALVCCELYAVLFSAPLKLNPQRPGPPSLAVGLPVKELTLALAQVT
jgi:hypothetical protein